MMRVQLSKGVCIGIPVEKNVPLMIAQVEDTAHLEERPELDELQFDESDNIRVKTKQRHLEMGRNGSSSGRNARDHDAVMQAIRSEYKEFKHLCQAIEFETNPVLVADKIGVNILMDSRINSIKEKEQVLGPVNSKGKKIKFVDLSN